MNCTEFEERIALFVENDLSDAEVTAVERHLETCTDCREFAAGLRESQAMLKGLRREPFDDAIFADVRSQVIGRVSNVRPPMWPKYAIAATLLIVLAAALWRTRPAAPVGLPAVTAYIGPGPAFPTPRTTAPRRASRIAKMTVRHGRAQSRPHVNSRLARQTIQQAGLAHPRALHSEPLVVKLLTNDPEVVIYWLVDQNGG